LEFRITDIPRLSFIAGLLHDIGKISLDFILSKEPGSCVSDLHGQILFSDRDVIPDNLWNFLNQAFPENPEVSIAKLICSHHGCKRCASFQNLCDGLEDNKLWKNLRKADRCDTSNPSEKGKQFSENLETIGIFGTKRLINPLLFQEKRLELYKRLSDSLTKSDNNILKLEFEWTEIVLEFGYNVLSETRHHATDLTLAGHMFATAILFSLLTQNEQLYAARVENTRENLESLKNVTTSRIIGWDKNWIALVTVSPEEFQEASPFNQFDEVGVKLCEYIPDSKPSPIKILKLCRGQHVKKPEDISEGYTMKKLTNDLFKLTELARLERSQSIETRIGGLKRHISNLKKALILGKLSSELKSDMNKKIDILTGMSTELSTQGSTRTILKRNNWRDSSHAYEWAWELLSKIMSPIRPTSPASWAKRVIDDNPNPGEREAIKWVLGRQFTLGRWFCTMIESAVIKGEEHPYLAPIKHRSLYF